MNYGEKPIAIGEFVTPCTELMYVLYLPVKLDGTAIVIPANMGGYRDFVVDCVKYENNLRQWKYIYLTVKSLYVQPGCLGGRLGWHTDGFGNDDVNYIWCDTDPTEFCVQPFALSDDHDKSIAEMTEQARPENIMNFGPCEIVRIDARHVHRCPENPKAGYRTFARVSFSDHKYDLIGNAHNHDLDYNWIMHPRHEARNDTSATRV